MSAATLRSAAKRGQLVIERVGGKDFTTLGHIKRMREQCRVKQVRRDCGCDQRAETKRAAMVTGSGARWFCSRRLICAML